MKEENIRGCIGNYIKHPDGMSPEEYVKELVSEGTIKRSYIRSDTNSQLVNALRVIELVIKESRS